MILNKSNNQISKWSRLRQTEKCEQVYLLYRKEHASLMMDEQAKQKLNL